VNKNTEKAKNVLLIMPQRPTYFKSNQAPPSIGIFLFATVMEGNEYFSAGLCFHLYLIPKWTKGCDVTVQIPCMTTDKNCSNFIQKKKKKKKSLMNRTQHSRIQSYTYYLVCSTCYSPHFHLASAD